MSRILKILIIFIIPVIIFSSCTMEKRHYFSGYNIAWNKSKTQPYNTKIIKQGISDFSGDVEDQSMFSNLKNNYQTEENLIASVDNINSVYNKNYDSFSSLDVYKEDLKRETNIINSAIQDTCDNIILTNGDEIRGKILEIGIEEIKYKKCDNLNGPTIIIRKSDVYKIKYINGTEDEFTTEYYSKDEPVSSNKESIAKKADGYGIISFIFSFIGIFFAGIPFGILAVIFGAISVGRVGKNYGKYSATALGVIGLILGAIDFILVLIILSSI